MSNQVKVDKRHQLTVLPKTRPQVRWDDLFFQILMFFHRPASWSGKQVIASLIFWAGLVFGLWRLAAPNAAFAVSLALLSFTLIDWLLLDWLPHAKRSFGPVNPQLMFMLIPRLLVAIGTAGLAHFGQPSWGVTAFFGLELAGTLAYLWGMVIEPQRLSITELAVTSPHLPAEAEPVRILHLSDLHIERLTRREAKVLRFIRETRPDLIVITGDYLNASNRCDSEAVDQVRGWLDQLYASGGVYAVLGTPSVDLPYIAPLHFQETDIQLLRRDVIEVNLGDGRKLALMGLDCTHDLVHDGALLEQLNRVAPADIARLFLYHSPELMPEASQYEIDLYLCGHTHGGQIRLPGYGAFFTSAATGKRYEMGRYDEAGTTLYVSRGIGLEGFSIPRIRLFCPPEITLVTLKGQE